MDVEVFLQENPDIAEQFSDFSDVVLLSNEDIVFDKKDELQIISKSNEEFSEWENDFPKLKKEHISFPHKHKLFKFEKRRLPQWTYYAAAACMAIVIFTILDFRITNDELTEPIAVLPITETPIEITNYELQITSDLIAENRHEVRGRFENLNDQQLIKPQRPITEPIAVAEIPEALEGLEATDEPDREFFAIATLTPIGISIDEINQKSEIKNQKSIDNEQILHVVQDDNPIIEDVIREATRRERIEIAFNNNVVTPVKNTVHNVVRQFYVRKTEVELFLEEREPLRFFAQR
jgi:hypothetical protein